MRSLRQGPLRGLLVGILLCSLGCSGLERPADDFDDKPLPYNVGVFFDVEASAIPEPLTPEAAGEPFVRPRFQLTGDELAGVIAKSLEESGIVSSAEVAAFSGRKEALEASKFDFVVAVAMNAPSDFGEPTRPLGMGSLEVGGWLFGGIPSWFTPTHEYETKTELSLYIADLNHFKRVGSKANFKHVATTSVNAVSLWDRAEFSENFGSYAMSIIVPPMFIPAVDEVAAGEAVTNEIMNDLNAQLLENLKPEWVERELEGPLRIAFLEPYSGSQVDTELPLFRMELVSQNSVQVKALDLHVFDAEDAQVYAWAATDKNIAALNKFIGESGRVKFPVPDGLSLAAGDNRVKVRVLRTDGVMITRTAVYNCEEKR